MKSSILAGVIGAISMVFILFVFSVYTESFNYKAIYLINPEKIVKSDSLSIECLTSEKIAILNDLEDKGILLTPQEYTSHISSYYSTLVAFLIGLFVLFTIFSIYNIKITSKNELEEVKREIDKATTELDEREKQIKSELKTEIKNLLSELVKDSISFKEIIIGAIYGRIQDDLITKAGADKEMIEERVKSIENSLDFLFESVEEISNKQSSTEEME